MADWIDHDGNDCPVPPNSRPLLIFRDGWNASDAIRRNPKWRASSADWSQVARYLPDNRHG